MDNTAILIIPFETWNSRKNRIMLQYHHLRLEDLHFVEGQEDDLIRRLRVLLIMARRTVIDMIRNA